MVLPNHYASEYGVPLATLGALLLGARLLDAVADPWIGRRVDRLVQAFDAARAGARGRRGAGAARSAFAACSSRPCEREALLLAWCAALLAVTYLSYSVLSVLHQAWGARLGGDEAQRARIVSWREGLALVGVLVASVLPSLAGLSAASAGLRARAAGLRWACCAARRSRCRTSAAAASAPHGGASWRSLATPAFRRLLAIYLVNGVASAVPATLVLFFIRDRLQAQAWEPLFLASYFAAGALSMPLWVRAVRRFGLARAWLAGMALAIVTFGWAPMLGAGDMAAFTVVCCRQRYRARRRPHACPAPCWPA